MDYELVDVGYDPFAAGPAPGTQAQPAKPANLDPAASAQAISDDQFATPGGDFELIDVDYDPFAGSRDRGPLETVGNLGLGVLEGGLRIVGGIAGATGTAAEAGGDWLAETVGQPVLDESGLGWRRLTPEETAGDTSVITKLLREVAEGLRDPDLGYEEQTTWDQVVDAPISNVVPFALEQGLISAADMYAAVTNLPGYVMSQTGTISYDRAKNDNRDEATMADLVAALPAATLSAYLEKIGTSKILGLDDVALTKLKQLPPAALKSLIIEGGTEVGQELATYGGETIGTEAGFKLDEAAHRALVAGIVGSIFGPAVRTPIGALEIATAKPPKTAADEADPENKPVNPAAPASGGAAAGLPTPGGEQAAIAPQPVGTPGTATQPEAAAAASPVVVVQDGVAPDVAAATTPSAAPAAAPVVEQPASPAVAEDEDIEPAAPVTAEAELSPEEIAKRQKVAAARKRTIQSIDASSPVAADLASALTPQTTTPQSAPAIPMPEPAGTPEAAARRTRTPKQPTPPQPAAAVVSPVPAPVATAEAVPNVVQPPVVTPEVAPAPSGMVSTRIVNEDEDEGEGPSLARAKAKIASLTGRPQEPAEAPPVLPAVQAQPIPAPPPAAAPAAQAPEIRGEPPPAPALAPRIPGKLTFKSTAPAPAAPVERTVEKGLVQAAPVKVQEVKRRVAERKAKEEKPAAEPEAKPAPKNAQRLLEGKIREALGEAHPLTDETDFQATIERVAAEHTTGLPKGVAPAKAVEERVQAAREAVEKHYQERQATAAVEAETKAEAQHKAAIAKAKSRERSHAKTGKEKPAEAIGEESDKTLKAAIAAETAKPEAERDPDVMEIAGLLKERKKKKGGGERLLAERAAINEQIKAVQARRAGKVAERQKAAEAAKPKEAPPKPVEKTRAETFSEAIDSVPQPQMSTMAQLKTAGRQFMNDVVAAVRATGKAIPDEVTVNSPPAEILAAYAAREKASPQKFLTGLILWRAGETTEFRNLFASEILEGTTVAIEKQADTAQQAQAKRAQSKRYEGPPEPEHDPRVNEDGLANRDDFYRPDSTTSVEMTVDKTGEKFSAREHSRYSGKQMLDMLRRASRRKPFLRGWIDQLTRMHTRNLLGMVGNVPVVFVDQADVNRAAGATDRNVSGFYDTKTNTVYISVQSFVRDRPTTRQWQQHILLHELTHAATVYAYRWNVNGVQVAIRELFREFKHQARPLLGALGPGTEYALTDEYEFIAQAFSDPRFQQVLSEFKMPAGVASHLRYMLAGSSSAPSWWDAFVDWVSRAMGGTRFGGRGSSFMEGIISIYPELMQQPPRLRAVTSSMFRGPPDGPLADSVVDNARAQVSDRMERIYTDRFRNSSRYLRQKLATTKEIMRRSARYWGGENNPLTHYGTAVLKAAQYTRRMAQKGNQILADMVEARRGSETKFKEAENILYDATVGEYNPLESIKHETNKHIRGGLLDTARREEHARAHAAWNKLPEKVKKPLRAWVEHLQDLSKQRTSKIVRNIVDEAQRKYGLTLPSGETTETVTNWVLSGEIDRRKPVDPAKPDPNDRTARDEALHKALGGTADSLKDSKSMHQIRGIYVPLMRHGKLFFQGRHKIDVPEGAVLADEEEAPDQNVLVFNDKKKLKAWLKTAGGGDKTQIQGKPKIVHIDPSSGEEVGAKDVRGRPFYYVTIQNKGMFTSDSQVELERMRDELLADGWDAKHMTAIGEIDRDLNKDSELLPQHVRQLLRSAEQAIKDPNTTKSVAGGIVDAYIRQLSGNRAAHRRLKRTGIKGFSRDLLRNSRDVHDALVGHVASLDTNPEQARLYDEAHKYVEDRRKNDYGSDFEHRERQSQLAEVAGRAVASRKSGENNWINNKLRTMLDVSYIARLMTPAYSVANVLGGQATGFSALAGKHGGVSASAAMIRASKRLGFWRTLGRGAAETVTNIKAGATTDWAEYVKRKVAGDKLATAFVNELEEQGLGVGAGLETAAVTTIGNTPGARLVDRTMRLARALPEAAETVNRYITGFAALELAKAKGLSDEAAIAEAINTVEVSQGGYNVENNPAFFNNPWLRVPLQFKKYGLLYGQMYYGALYRSLALNTDPAMRKEAARTFAYMSITGVMLAGAFGLPFMEFARMFGIISLALGGDDWEATENWLQEALGEIIGGAPSEAMTRGWSRLLGIDLSNRLGNDQMIFFGEPDKIEEKSVKAWMFDLLAGSAGGIAGDTIKGMSRAYDSGDVGELVKRLPAPKFITDAYKAYEGYESGPTTEAGRVLGEPLNIGETVAKLSGLKPASEARRWETGGGGAEHREREADKLARSRIMGRWVSAGPGERQKIFHSDVRAWNREHPEMKITFDALQRSKRSRKQREKEEAD